MAGGPLAAGAGSGGASAVTARTPNLSNGATVGVVAASSALDDLTDVHQGLDLLQGSNIRLSKLHLSSALRAQPTPDNLATLQSFVEQVYLHQVVRSKDGRVLDRIKDLDLALDKARHGKDRSDEWRVHFHVPLHASPGNGLGDTQAHVLDTLDWLQKNPNACYHLEMETYTWEVLPPELKSLSVVEQVTKEYEWTLNALRQRDLAK